VAGESLDDAIAVARGLNTAGLSVSLDYLGESVGTRREAEKSTEATIRSIRRVRSGGIRGNVSVKPTQLGLGLDADLCFDNLSQILAVARDAGDGGGELFVRVDMESSDYTEATIRLVEDLWVAGYRNVGTVIQSCLHRSIDDLRRLIGLGMRIRLVKGAYLEPRSIAYQSKATVDRAYLRGMKMLLREGAYPAIATHDESIIEATRHFAFEHGIPRDSYEFQLLYGVRRDLQHKLREEGHNVRIYLPYGESWYPYLMRRLGERPGNLIFLAGSVMKESPFRMLTKPAGLGAGLVAGVAGTVVWRRMRAR
jgi:proline dehydrogenase